MIIGHVGAALVAKRYRADVPLVALLLAALAPDVGRVLLLLAGVRRDDANLFTHALPWCVLLAGACGVVVWLKSRNRASALTIASLVLSHAALDMLSGRKPLWLQGPRGADLASIWYAEFALEGLLLWGGWWLLRRRMAEWRTAKAGTTMCLLTLMQLAIIADDITRRPWKDRCLSHPAKACADGSWLTANWRVSPWFVGKGGPGEQDGEE